MSTPEVVSLAQFSRMHGVSRKTASEWKRAGHLVMSDDGGVVVGPSNEKLRERTRRYRGGVTRGPVAEDGADASAAAEAGVTQVTPEVIGRDGEVLLSEDQWDAELIREAFARLLAIGIKQCEEETLVAVCDQVLLEWRGAA